MINVFKAGMAWIVLTVCGFANAGLIAYDFSGAGQGYEVTGTLIFDETDVIPNSEFSDALYSYELNVKDDRGSLVCCTNTARDYRLDLSQFEGDITLDVVAASMEVREWVNGNRSRLKVDIRPTYAYYENRLRQRISIYPVVYTAPRYVEVPEPSTLAIFALGIMGLASRRFKKQS